MRHGLVLIFGFNFRNNPAKPKSSRSRVKPQPSRAEAKPNPSSRNGNKKTLRSFMPTDLIIFVSHAIIISNAIAFAQTTVADIMTNAASKQSIIIAIVIFLVGIHISRRQIIDATTFRTNP